MVEWQVLDMWFDWPRLRCQGQDDWTKSVFYAPCSVLVSFQTLRLRMKLSSFDTGTDKKRRDFSFLFFLTKIKCFSFPPSTFVLLLLGNLIFFFLPFICSSSQPPAGGGLSRLGRAENPVWHKPLRAVFKFTACVFACVCGCVCIRELVWKKVFGAGTWVVYLWLCWLDLVQGSCEMKVLGKEEMWASLLLHQSARVCVCVCECNSWGRIHSSYLKMEISYKQIYIRYNENL